MRRAELLNLAWIHVDVRRNVLNAARVATSDAALAARMTALRRRRRVITALNLLLIPAAGGAIFFSSLNGHPNAHLIDKFYLFLLLTIFCAPVAAAFHRGFCALARLGEMSWFEPAAGTDLCVRGAAAVQSSGWAREWRDLALKERTQLRRFDIIIMEALRDRQEKDQSEKERQAAIYHACRTLHDVPDSVQS